MGLKKHIQAKMRYGRRVFQETASTIEIAAAMEQRMFKTGLWYELPRSVVNNLKYRVDQSVPHMNSPGFVAHGTKAADGRDLVDAAHHLDKGKKRNAGYEGKRTLGCLEN
jgi:hypothetical protein